VMQPTHTAAMETMPTLIKVTVLSTVKQLSSSLRVSSALLLVDLLPQQQVLHQVELQPQLLHQEVSLIMDNVVVKDGLGQLLALLGILARLPMPTTLNVCRVC
jgi:hypothetical protein